MSTPLAIYGSAEWWRNGVLQTHNEMTPQEAILYPYERHYCEDVVNSYDTDNPLLIEFEGRQFVPLDGTVGTITNYAVFRNHIPTLMKGYNAHLDILPSIPSVGTVATAVIARSNPSRPYVSIPNFLYELKDLPGMIRDIGNFKRQLLNTRKKGVQQVTAKNAASHLLSYQMGWSPLLSDLRKLLDFQAQVDKKLRELQNLYNNGGLQRRIRSPAWEATMTEKVLGNWPMESLVSSSIRADLTKFTTVRRWGTVRWYPASLPDARFSSKKMARLARDLVFGMNGVSAKQLWDAIPWTWLIGWFSNADEYIQAHSNAIPLVHSKPCIMTERTTKVSWTRTDTVTTVKGGYGAMGLSTKQRTTSSGTLSATIPFLSNRQISILGALAIQRKR